MTLPIVSRLAPGQIIEIGDILVSLPSGHLYVAANITTGIVYSASGDMTSFLPHPLILDESKISTFTYNVTIRGNAPESRSITMSVQQLLGQTSLANFREYLRDNASALLAAAQFPQICYVVVAIGMCDNQYACITGMVLRAQPAHGIPTVNTPREASP
ncbi:hypothetical protein ONZ45_g7264 [Pleurotus djamor]|nr:hypothetical protein ONZ45_g7264 [Pleurotus djamor]